MNKIEAANALAKACELFDTDEITWDGVMHRLSRYRSASVPSDDLTDEEREVIVDAMQAYLVGDPKCAPARSILRKLGREPEPVWEWDNANAMWTLGGKVDSRVFPCASVMLSSAGLVARVYLSEMNATSVNVDSYTEACEWCEKQLREARK